MAGCATEAPLSSVYFQTLDMATLVLTVIAGILTLACIILYFVQITTISRYISTHKRRTRLRWLAGVFPVTALCSFAGVCVPAALPPMESFLLLYTSRCLFTFLGLIFDLFGDRGSMSLLLGAPLIHLAAPPCCCCCVCLPSISTNQRSLRGIEYLVLQVAFVRVATLFIFVVATNAFSSLPHLCSALNIINGISTIFAVYGCTLLINLVKDKLATYRVRLIFGLIQGVLVFSNLQGAIFSLLANAGVIKCNANIVQCLTRASIWHHLLLITEICGLSLLGSWSLRPSKTLLFDRHRQVEPSIAITEF